VIVLMMGPTGMKEIAKPVIVAPLDRRSPVDAGEIP
jgi:hypothetical protein